jgi:WD40 repeat protein
VVIQAGHAKRLYAVTISGDGKHAVTGSEDKTAILGDAATGQKLLTFAPSVLDGISRVVLSNDGKHLATCIGGVSAYWMLWDTASGQPLKKLSGRAAGTAKLIEDESALRYLYRPGLLATLWKSEDP